MVDKNEKKSLFFSKDKEYIEEVDIFSIHVDDDIFYFLDNEEVKEKVYKNYKNINKEEKFKMKVYFKKLKYKENMDIIGNNINIENFDQQNISKSIDLGRLLVDRFIKTINKIEITGDNDFFVSFDKDDIFYLESSLLAIINVTINSKL